MADYRKRYYHSNKLPDSMRHLEFMFRDSMMFENAKRLVQREKKIMIWAASIHLSKSTASLKDKNYKGKLLGYYLCNFFNSKYYFIAFTQNRGVGGYSTLFSYKFKPAKRGSFEYFIEHKYNVPFCFYNLRNPDAIYNMDQYKVTRSKIFWRKELSMCLPNVCDGLFYTYKMERPVYVYIN
jgi:erythromycin esterase-like protein